MFPKGKLRDIQTRITAIRQMRQYGCLKQASWAPSWPGLSGRIDTGHLVSLVPQFHPGGPQPQGDGGDIK